MKSKFLLLLFLILLFFTRLYNLQNTARFIWDESSDLVHMHQIFVEKKLTLVGPISEDGTKVFGSLTYYMLLPFAILSQFDPASPAVGAAFWSILTAILLLILAKKINSSLLLYVAFLALFWFPLVQTGRWAWNPNLIPFWVTLGLLLYPSNSLPLLFLSGLSLGLAIHHHYLSIFPIASFAIITFIKSIRNKYLTHFIALASGIGLALLPFVIFDLRHPPGLFLSKILYSNHSQLPTSIFSFLSQLTYLYKSMLLYFSQNLPATFLLAFLAPLLLVLDFKNKKSAFLYAIPWLLHLVALSFVYYDGQSEHYFLPALIFFLAWLIFPRPRTGQLLAKTFLLILIASSLFSIIPQLNRKTWQTDIPSVKTIVQFIKVEILTNDLKNSNLSVLASPDNNIYGRRYRDLLLIDNFPIKSKEEYEYSDHLFVISTSSEAVLRSDRAAEMRFFNKGPLIKSWPIPNSPWYLYRFDRNPTKNSHL